MKIGSEYISSLPVAAIADRVNKALLTKARAVVTAPPGSGKSTLLPLTILQGMTSGKVVMLEPRRAAARQIAMRMARMIGEEAGQTVGYRMRFESKVSSKTRLEVVTEGVMERMLTDDPTLDGIGAVIFDEFHERSLTADLSLALTLEAQNVLRPDLRVVIMSATMDTDALCRRLDAPVIQASGKMYDVRIYNGDDIDIRECAECVASAVRKAWREQEGDILAFLPGQAEILRCQTILEQGLPEAVILPLHGMLPPAQQYRAIEYRPEGSRRIVLATPVAETSLTIGGIRTVVDSGFYRAVRFNPVSGLGHLVTERISLDMAVQRAGRAGRLSDGVCYRLWSKATEYRMSPSRVPEILEADLSAMMLDIAVWGGSEAEKLPWLTPPPAGHVAEGRRLLRALGAFGEDNALTGHGKQIAKLPCHPRIANMLVRASGDSMRALAADIAAILEEKDPVCSDGDADINMRIDLLRRQRRKGDAVSGVWKRIAGVASQYRRITGCAVDNSPVNDLDTGRLLLYAYPERLAMRVGDGVFRLPSGENVTIGREDDLAAREFLAVAAMGRRIFLASSVRGEDVEALSKPYTNISWDSREGRLVARNELRVGVLITATRSVDSVSPETKAQVLARAAQKEGRGMFDFNDSVCGLQQRIAAVAEWHPELGLPDVTTDRLLADTAGWLPMYLGKAATRAELRRIDMCRVIEGVVGYDMMAAVDRIAPTHIKLPSGRTARIDYRPGSPDPVVSARLQDCLGMADTPRIDNGRRPVLMELLSPGYKPVQLTRDLRGFWTSTYFEVRKELRRRYPKHRWPDDPLSYISDK